MDIQQIRNATLKIVYQGKTFLIDPWLCGKGSLGSFEDIPGKPYMIPDPVKMEIAMPIYGLPRTPPFLKSPDFKMYRFCLSLR